MKIKDREYKTLVQIFDKDGVERLRMTSWRKDIPNEMVKVLPCEVEDGEYITIKIEPMEKEGSS